jgi:benzylsuccinate CoA-transferase BbsE subunit
LEEILTSDRDVGLLSGVRVVDLSGFEGMYGARLLADLGADVVRVVRDDVHTVEPGTRIMTADGTMASAFVTFANLNKRAVRVDVSDEDELASLQEIVNASHLVLADELPEGVAVPDHVALVSTSIFGHIGRGADLVGSDLVGLAAGGLLSLGGYPDTAPVAVYGNQAYMCGGIMTGVASLLALLGSGDAIVAPRADVSVQATLVGALEDATAEFDLCSTVRHRAGDQPREAGTGIFRSADGYIAIVAGKLGTAQAWLSLVKWLNEGGVEGAEELTRPEWTTLEKRRDLRSLEFFMEVFESFTMHKTSGWLYREGQSRSIAIAPVNTMREVLADPQLTYRDFFRTINGEGFDKAITVPGKPYRLYDLANFDSWSLCRDASLEDVRDEWSHDEVAVPAQGGM